jgi:hypothetical protein
MEDWTRLDSQMRRYSPYLRDELMITSAESNALATTIAQEIRSLPRDAIQTFFSDSYVQPKDRLDELVAFQSFMDFANANASLKNPGLTRAQVITQNYIAFVYLGDACFKALKNQTAPNSVTKRCCKFLTDNPVRAFRNAVAHANWKYQPDLSGLIFWAHKGSDPSEPLVQFEVSQNDLSFWQALARCVAYVAYLEAWRIIGKEE